jgi:hypothetical protein
LLEKLVKLHKQQLITNTFSTRRLRSLIAALKGIVYRDFGVLFMISLDSYEVHSRAGYGLFFILLAFSYINFKKVDIHGKEQFGAAGPRIVTVRRIFLAF